jgi:hypothetical protein
MTFAPIPPGVAISLHARARIVAGDRIGGGRMAGRSRYITRPPLSPG